MSRPTRGAVGGCCAVPSLARSSGDGERTPRCLERCGAWPLELVSRRGAPLLHTAFTADPAARVLDDGALYVLMSHDTDTLDEEHRGTASQFRMSDYRLLRARRPNAPLEDLGVPLTLASVPWAAGQLWAPDLSRGPDGRYHLLFPAKVRLIPSDYLSPSDPF